MAEMITISRQLVNYGSQGDEMSERKLYYNEEVLQ